MIKPRAMRKLPECVRCRFFAHEPFIICAIFPTGSVGESCPHFAPNPDHGSSEDFFGLQWQTGEDLDGGDEPFSNPFDLEPNESLWEPDGASYYAGELIVQPEQRWTREEQLKLLEWHPIFTNRCPQCQRSFPRYEKLPVHWDCECGWMDDTI